MHLSTVSHPYIPVFLSAANPADPARDAAMAELNRIARAKGWRAALQQIFGDVGSGRASFASTLPLTPQSDVLEIGPGLGHLTDALARRVRSVSALELVPARAEFIAERCRQEGLANVWMFIGGDDCRMPFGPATFDVVVVHPTVERCASHCTDVAAADAQHRFLDEIRFVLKPGGTLHLATDSKLAMSA